MKVPAKLIRAFLPREVKEMLNVLKGSRTLLLLVIANLPDAAESLSRIIMGVWGQSVADDVVKVVTGIVAIFTVLVRLLPEEQPVKDETK
jgi:hypothetical protein